MSLIKNLQQLKVSFWTNEIKVIIKVREDYIKNFKRRERRYHENS